MIFEIGKFYKHTTGEKLSVICEAETTLYGKTMIAESSSMGNFISVGGTEEHAFNWKEISHEEWMKDFS